MEAKVADYCKLFFGNSYKFNEVQSLFFHMYSYRTAADLRGGGLYFCIFLFSFCLHVLLWPSFFAETETLPFQGHVTRDFWKSYSIRPKYSTFKHFRVCSVCDKLRSTYARVRWNLFRVCSAWIYNIHVKTVHILPLAEDSQKFIPRLLSVR